MAAEKQASDAASKLGPDGNLNHADAAGAIPAPGQDAARSLQNVEATWSDELTGLLLLYLYAPGRRKAAPVASTKKTTAEVMIDYDEVGAILGVEVIASVG